MQRTLNVLLAMTTPDDIRRVSEKLAASGAVLTFADSLKSVERAMDTAEVIVTDTEFASGAFADWLSLWPIPAVLVVQPGFNAERLAGDTTDESSTFIVRDQADAWIEYLPILVRKSASIRESLDRQNTTTIRAEHSYMHLLRVVPDIVYVLDGDGCFAYLNDAVSQLGWSPAELIGKHFAEIVHPDDLPTVGRSIVLRRFEGISTGSEGAPKLFDERRSGDRMTRNLEVRLRHRDGTQWSHVNVDAWGEVTSLGINLPEFQGRGTGTVGLIHDISRRHELEESLSRELDSRNLLLKEIHHRVKNNLQVVSSLLSLESDCVVDEKAREVFDECQTQVYSMSLVHEQIYRGTSQEGVEASGYFARLAEYLASVHDSHSRGIALNVEAGSLVLPIDIAMPLSIITTELVSNAFKHGFPDDRHGSICIYLRRENDGFVFSIIDDGVGFTATENEHAASGKTRGIGMDLISALVSQMGGTMERIDQNGSSFVLRFPG